MGKEIYLMNPVSGEVDTRENWVDEMRGWELSTDGLSPQQQFDLLREVKKDESGNWVEVD